MRIRNKLLLAMAVPVGLLVLQLFLVNHFIRELQSAVTYISSANSVIERNFIALEKLAQLRTEIKQVPAGFVGTNKTSESPLLLIEIWNELSHEIDQILLSDAFKTATESISEAVVKHRLDASRQIQATTAVASALDSDLDTLLETAILADRDLTVLEGSLSGLVKELRQQLQEAVAHEKKIHNRPIIAGVSVGGLVILVIVLFTWLYVDGHLVSRITALSSSMLAISNNDLKADIPESRSPDEIGEMADALSVFRDTAVEIEENNLREIANAQQRLIEAIATLTEGFSLYDAHDRLVICNPQYGTLFYPGLEQWVKPGVLFEDLLRAACSSEQYVDAVNRHEQWIGERMDLHRQPVAPLVLQHSDGRWIEITEHITTNGETVAIYADITHQRNSEIALMEAKRRSDEANKLVMQKNAMLEGLSAKLSKYLSPQIYSSIFRGDRDVELKSERKKLTIVFTDLSGFTETADRLESEELTGLLNNYLTEMSKLALDHGATIDKYIGDAIMLFFGDPDSQGVQLDAIASVKTAIAMQQKMSELNVLWQKRGIEKPLELRIGINTGYCTVGNFGSEDRMDYTIIGSEVNLAERLESLADPGGILVGHETSCLVNSHIHLDEQTPKMVKGFANPVRNYKVIGWRNNSTEPSAEAKFHLGDVSLVLNQKTMSKEEQQDYVNTLNEIMAYLTAEAPPT